jgi:NADH-quinone oxidoreductase subunit F
VNKLESIGQLEWLRNRVRAQTQPEKTIVNICLTGCRSYGAVQVKDALEEAVKKQGLLSEVEIRSTGCHGCCAKAPVMLIEPQGIFYQAVTPEDVDQIVARTLKKGQLIDYLAIKDSKTGKPIFHRSRIPFFSNQTKRVLANCGRIDPTNIEHAIAVGGYGALAKALVTMTPEAIIEEITAAKLRGRGGGGFPTGVKWDRIRRAGGSPKYLICNGDEGDPGSFKDRALLEGDPHAVLEGMLIGAYAVGATIGLIYTREQYPIAVDHLTIAIGQLRELGLLGDNILGTGFSFDISLNIGPGAFVCGEETALIASIQGKRGMPQPRPPYPFQSGLDEKPTIVNNVETLANVPLIIRNGSAWYTRRGTAQSGGTKILSLAGKVSDPGLVEVPMGVSIKEVVFNICGGVPMGRRFKAVQMGGPSGGCIPARFLNLAVDYETIRQVGAFMGSGDMLVLDENNCMVEMARFFLAFTQAESCGQCAPCRLGTTQMLTILSKITRGEGRLADIETMVDLGETISAASLCGLGKNCARPAITALKYFGKEFEDHILNQRCAGTVCESMVISACQHACPAGIDVPNYIAAIACGKYEQAVAIIRERNPFPAVCGRICVHPCEYRCRRGQLDAPVAIRSLKRFAADWYFEHIKKAKAPFPVTKSQKVAVVGAGPAGLSCAYFLAQKGYQTIVFELQERGGGMLGLALPEFRLPAAIIAKEIGYIESCGVEIRFGSPIDTRHTINDLLMEGYKAVFIAAGAQSRKWVGIPGAEEDLTGLYHGLEFLTKTRVGPKIRLDGRVVVIGGGNVAMDVARTALRLGAAEVQIFYRRSREEMSAWEKDIEETLEEGIVINTLWTPKEILYQGRRRAPIPRSLTALFGVEQTAMPTGGKVTGISFARSRSALKEDGRTCLVVDDGATRIVDAETIIIAIGQAPDASFLPLDSRLERDLWAHFKVDPNTLSTNISGIFAGGDFVTGPSTVIEAIASGRRAAIAIDRHICGEGGPVRIKDEKTAWKEDARLALADETTEGQSRIPSNYEIPGERLSDFREVEKGFTEQQAVCESLRCLRCDLEREKR